MLSHAHDRVLRAAWGLAVVSGGCSKTEPTAAPQLPAVETPAVETPAAETPAAETASVVGPDDHRDPASPAPDPEPVFDDEPTDTAIQAIVEDLGVILGRDVGCLGIPCRGTASWTLDDFETDDSETDDDDFDRMNECSWLVGTTLNILDDKGIEQRRVTHGAPPRVGATAGRARLRLAFTTRRVSFAARLERRVLTSIDDGTDELTQWLRERFDEPIIVPKGEVRGRFSDDVDRIAVFQVGEDPVKVQQPGFGPREVAVLVAGSTPTGLLPWDDVWEDSNATGLQVVNAMDLDGDGTEELLWMSQTADGELMTGLAISYVSGGQFRLHPIHSCSLAGCEAYLPERDCRGFVKRRRGG